MKCPLNGFYLEIRGSEYTQGHVSIRIHHLPATALPITGYPPRRRSDADACDSNVRRGFRMDEVVQPDYAVPRRCPLERQCDYCLNRWACSGPIAFVVVRLTDVAYGISRVGSGCVVAVGIPVFAFCLWVYTRLEDQKRGRGRVLALIGLIATLLWAVGLIALFIYIDCSSPRRAIRSRLFGGMRSVPHFSTQTPFISTVLRGWRLMPCTLSLNMY